MPTPLDRIIGLRVRELSQAVWVDAGGASECSGETQQGELVSAMSDKKEAEKAKAPTPREIFVGIKGRPPKTDQELKEWLASDEGKTASMFEPSSTTRWGEGRS